MAPIGYIDPHLIDSELLARDQASKHDMSNCRIVNIEHPCIIDNVDNSIKSLGGPARLNEVS